MSEIPGDEARAAVEAVYRAESRRVLATLIRLLGEFDIAEEGLHDAVAAALEQWPREGVPQNPRAWLVSTGRFKAIDAARRRARFQASVADLATRLEHTQPPDPQDEASIDDDHLRLIFTCCHPACWRSPKTDHLCSVKIDQGQRPAVGPAGGDSIPWSVGVGGDLLRFVPGLLA